MDWRPVTRKQVSVKSRHLPSPSRLAVNFFLLGTLRPTAKVVGNTLQHVFMVMEYVEHELKVLLVQHAFAVAEQKCLLRQLLAGVAHLHLKLDRNKTGSPVWGRRWGGKVVSLCPFRL